MIVDDLMRSEGPIMVGFRDFVGIWKVLVIRDGEEEVFGRI